MVHGTILEAKDCSLNIKKFTIGLESPLKPKPGQYIMVEIQGQEPLKRAYSIIECNGKSVSICVKKMGEFTKRLFEFSIGSSVEIYGPYGRFTLPQLQSPLVFIAGGIGITPIYSMASSLIKDGWAKDVCLFYSCKSKKEMCFYEQILSWDKSRIGAHLFFTEECIDVNCNRRLDVEEIRNHCADFQKSMYYICGPSNMIEDISQQLIQNGISDEMIKVEAFK